MTLQNAIFWGLHMHAGAMTPKFELCQDFCTMHKFRHPVFSCSEVIVLTNTQTNPQNKQIPAKTSNVLRYATTLGNCTAHRGL